MSILSRLLPWTQPAPMQEHRFQVRDGKLGVVAETLDGYSRGQENLDLARALISCADQMNELKALDQQPGDQDGRPGHVVSPQMKAELHDGVGSFRKAFFDGHGVAHTTTVTPQPTGYQLQRVCNGEKRPSAQATYNPEDGTLSLFTAAPKEKPEAARLVETYKFTSDASGQIAFPQVSSLQEYDGAASARASAQRVGQLLHSAEVWHSAALGFDGQPSVDKNLQEGAVVVPYVARETVSHALEQDPILAGARDFHIHDLVTPRLPCSRFSMEADADRVKVAANYTGVTLSSQKSASTQTLTLDTWGEREVVTRNLAEGTTTYQRFDVDTHRLNV